MIRKINKINLKIFIAAGLFIALFSYFASAGFGVSTIFTEEEPLTMYPGQSSDYSFTLQNAIGEEDMTIEAILTKGEEIARFTDRNLQYDVAFGSQEKVNVRIEIPESIPIGTEYVIEGLFKPVSPQQEGEGVQLSTHIRKAFKVVVIAQPSEPEAFEEQQQVRGVNMWMWVLGIIILIIIIWLIIKALKKKKA